MTFTIKTLLAAFLSLTVMANVQGQTPQTISMKPMWKVGDGITLTRIKEKMIVEKGKLVPQTQAKSTVVIKILKKTDKKSIISWTTSGTKVQLRGNPEVQAVVKKLGELTPTVQITFEANELGQPMKLVNRQEVISFYQNVMLKMKEWMTAQGTNPQLAQGILGQLSLYTNPKSVDFISLRDPLIYFARFDTLTMGKPRTQEVAIPNPGDKDGTHPFPATATTNLVKVDSGLAYIEFTQALNREKASQILLEAMQQEAIAAGQPLPTKESVPAFDLRSQIRMRMNLKTSLPIDLTNMQTKISGPSGQVDRTSFFRKQSLAPTSKPTSKSTSKSTSK